MKLPKLIITDIDGVWTSGHMFYDEMGNEIKQFHTYDSAGILFCKKLNIPVAIMTGETTNAVERRAKKLKIDYLFQGCKNKTILAQNLCKELNITLEDVAFIGDDINDFELMTKVGFSACPKSAPHYAFKRVHKVLDKKGGEGVFREFVEFIISESGYNIDDLINSVIKRKIEQ
ncbi:MAG: KdsC family phosphatase [Flavobacteriales bacterium]